MRKRTLGIVVGVVLVAALGAAAFLLLRNAPEDASDASSAEESSAVTETLTEQNANDVTSIDVTNTNGSFEVIRTAESNGAANAVYAVSGWEDLPTDTSKLWTLPNNTASMSTTGVVEENSTDLAKFGLDDATATAVTLHFEDGSTFAFRVGNAAADSENTYFAKADSDTVYTVKTSLVANFKNAAIEFLSKTMLEAPAEEADYPIVKTLTLKRTDMEYEMELVYDETSDDADNVGGTVASHEMVSPVPAYLSPDRSTAVVTGMFGLTAKAVAMPHPTDTDMETAGLKEPFGTATMDCDDGNTYVLQIGDKVTLTDEATETTTDCYYAYLEGVDAIYQVAEEDMVWATTTPTDIASKLVIGTYVWDVGDLSVAVDGTDTMTFQVSATEKDDAVVTLNGESTDAERYREFYSFLLNTTAETVELNATPVGAPLAEIKLKKQDGSFSRDLAFYAIDDFTCLITVDGKSAYTCRKSYLDTLRQNMEKYDTDEDFALNWS